MVKKLIKIIIILLVLLVVCPLTLLWWCSSLSRRQTPVEEKGISIGFQYENSKGALITAIKSDKKEFDIDDVTLDFYYGGIAKDDGCNLVALYFVSEGYNWYKDFASVADYKDIDGCYFIKEMTVDEYDSSPYDIEIRWNPRQKKKEYEIYFHYVDTLTVPKEMFSKQTGTVSFLVAHIDLNEDGTYGLSLAGGACSQTLNYIKTEAGTVELKKG